MRPLLRVRFGLDAGILFGYPITPQNEIPEYMSKRMPEVGGTFIQAESEVSAINMVMALPDVAPE